MNYLPASNSYLATLKENLKTDSVCAQVMDMCMDGCTDKKRCETPLQPYWAEQAFLTVQEGLLLKDSRPVIPSALRNQVLDKLHEGSAENEHDNLCGGRDSVNN